LSNLILTKQQKFQIMLLMTMMFFVGVSATDIYIASLPKMVLDFHSSPSVINLTLSSYSLGVAFAVLFVGEISSRYGRRRCLLLGVLCFSVAAFLIAVLPSIELIILLRVVQAFGCAVIIIVPRLVLKDCMDEREQITANGILLMGLIISPAIAPVIGAYLAKFWGWRSCFALSGVFGLILVVWGYFILPETNRNPLLHFQRPSYYLKTYFQLLTNRMFLALTGVYAAGVAAYFTFIGISSYLYIDHWHMSPQRYSFLYLWLSGAYLSGNQIMQYLNGKHLPAVKIIRFGVYATFTGAVVVGTAWFIPSPTLAMVVVTAGVLFMRSSNALINPPTQIRIMSHFEQNSAQALGLNMCIGFVVSSLAILLVTLFAHQPLTGLVLVSGFFALIVVCSYRFNRKILY
jgi:DHA1 family bicyclomycin/chloramphenicol resistance-like MFS transporter